jgi:hypothetical protein
MSRQHSPTSADGADELDFLRDLAHLHDRNVPPVEQVHRRAGAIRTAHRRARAGVGVAALATALAIGGVVLPQDSGPSQKGTATVAAAFLGVVPARAADGSDADCRVSTATALDRAQWASTPVAEMTTLLPKTAVGAPLRAVAAGQAEGTCPAPTPAAVLYAQDPQLKGLTLWADVADPYTGQDGLRTVTVRGTSGQLFTFDTGSFNLSWVAADGTRWLAEASGIDEGTFVRTLNGLQLHGEELDTASVPAGWQQAPLPAHSTQTTEFSWRVEYGSPGAKWTPDRVTLEVHRAVDSPAVAIARFAAGSTLTSVNGHLAVWSTNGPAGSDLGASLQWQDEQFTYVLTGEGGAQRLQGMAEQVEHVAAADPRIQGASDARDVPDEGH